MMQLVVLETVVAEVRLTGHAVVVVEVVGHIVGPRMAGVVSEELVDVDELELVVAAAAIVELPNVVDLVKTQSVATLEQEHVGWVVL